MNTEEASAADHGPAHPFELGWSDVRGAGGDAADLEYVVCFGDAAGLKRYVEGLDLPPGQPLIVTVPSPSAAGAGQISARSTALAVRRWNPARRPLPKQVPSGVAAPDRRRAHARLLRALRLAFQQAVADRLMTGKRSDALMSALDDLVRRDANLDARPAAIDRIALSLSREERS